MQRTGLDLAGSKSQQFTVLQIDTVFDFYKPAAPLSNFVENFWLYEGDRSEQKIERILPTGTFELAINLDQNKLSFYAAERPENSSRFSGAVISGAHGRAFLPGNEDKVFIIGVHFKPGGAFPFLGLPASELADTHVDLETLWGASAGRLRERLCEAETSAERFELLEKTLLNRFYSRTQQHYAVSAALEMFGKNQAGQTIRDAANRTGLSQRRFIEVFKSQVGVAPKLYSRIQRFQQTRAVIKLNPTPDWSAVALDLGYFDQSHFIREFQEFSGLSPTEYLKQHKRFSKID